jgi:hypothetical protein
MPSLFEPNISTDILNRIEKLTPQSTALWGKMNVAQMLHHCNMALGTATGEVQLKTPFFLKLMQPLIKKVVMSNKPYKPGLPTAKEFIITTDKEFEAEKNMLLKRLHTFIENGEKDCDGRVHPAFGKLSAYEWGFSQWKHFDHHLKQFGV